MADFSAVAEHDPRPGLGEHACRAWLEEARRLAGCCREAIREVAPGELTVEAKPDRSLVTSADRAAERAFREEVASRHPEAGVVGEEFGRLNPEASLQWIIDPIDGTAEFAAGLPFWGTIIGLYLDGWPVVGVLDHPDLGLCADAAFGLGARLDGRRLALADIADEDLGGRERLGLPSRAGFRRHGDDEGAVFEALTRAHPNCRSLHTCYAHLLAATGGLDAAVEWEVRIWDLAATRVLVEEAGGRYASIRVREVPGVGTTHCAAFGRPALVRRLCSELA